jgi:hypothetical protein
MATSKQRSYSFGPQPQDEAFFEYRSLRPCSDGFIHGVFHSSNTTHGYPLREMGVSISATYEQVHGLNISPGNSLPCPSLGSPNADWFFSKAHLEPTTMFRICKADALQDECLGILALYPDERREALGQVRFDQYLSDGLNIEDCYFSNQTINGRLCVMIRTPLHRHGIGGIDKWHSFPTTGTVVWWFGLIGNQINILNDSGSISHRNS